MQWHRSVNDACDSWKTTTCSQRKTMLRVKLYLVSAGLGCVPGVSEKTASLHWQYQYELLVGTILLGKHAHARTHARTHTRTHIQRLKIYICLWVPCIDTVVASCLSVSRHNATVAGTRLANHTLRPIPHHVCYSLDSIFCRQHRKLSIWNDIHILVYYLQWTCIHSVSIGI